MRNFLVSAFVVVTTAILMSGCSGDRVNNSDVGLLAGAAAGGIIGNQIGRGGGRGAATLVGAFVGGIVGHEIGRSLDEEDRHMAREAEFEALERGNTGSARSWRNAQNGHYGEVVPSRPYKRGATDCRDYTHTVYIDGRPRTMRGTACRNHDGTWSAV